VTCDLPGILECINETATGRTVNCDSSIQVIKSAHIKVCTADTFFILQGTFYLWSAHHRVGDVISW